MKKHLATTTTFTLLALALGMTPAANATSGSLLSGYGGPGQGSQAILGSALLGGPSGGSPGSGSSSTAATTTSGRGSSLAQPNGSHSRHASRSARPHASTTPGAKTSASGSSAYPASHDAATSQASTDTSPLGLSGADLVYLLLALVALAATAALTRGLAGGRRGGDVHG